MAVNTPTGNQYAERSTLLCVTKGKFGQRKQVDINKVASGLALNDDGTPIDANEFRMQKLLLECSEVKDINSVDSEVTIFLRSVSLPSWLKNGIYHIPIGLVEAVEMSMNSFAARRKAAVERLKDVYEERVNERRKTLGPAFDANDYPVVDDLDRIFTFRWNFIALAMPANLPEDVAQAEKERAAAQYEEMLEGHKVLVRSELLKLLNTLTDKLTVKPGDKINKQGRKTFRDSAVENIQDFLTLFDFRNAVIDDVETAQLAAKVKELIEDVDADALRKDKVFKERVMETFSGVSQTLSDMIVDAPNVRKIKLPQRTTTEPTT